jgi:hypothetical protein
MQATMNVQPLNFGDRYSFEIRKRRTTFSTFPSSPAEPLDEFCADLVGEDAMQSRKILQQDVLPSFDEALDEEPYRRDDNFDEVEEEEEQDRQQEETEAVPSSCMPRYRRFLTEAEYQREATRHTRQQLKQSGLYYKHASHFWRLRLNDSLQYARAHLVKVLIALVVLAVPIVLGLYLANEGGSFGHKDVSMLPNLAHKVPSQYESATGGARSNSLLNRLLRQAGLAAKQENQTAEAIVPAPVTAPVKEVPVSSPAAQQQRQEDVNTDAVSPVGVYEEPNLFTSILPTMQGMNIFTFAYSAAVDFFSKTFGWSGVSNATA